MKNLKLLAAKAASGVKGFGGKAAATVAAVAAPVVSFAAAQDYSGVSTAITTEITGAMPTVLLIFGTLAGIGVGLRLIGRATKAR